MCDELGKKRESLYNSTLHELISIRDGYQECI